MVKNLQNLIKKLGYIQMDKKHQLEAPSTNFLLYKV